MASTKIEWADKVWNPITGCTPISEGCDHCYARRMANRLAGRYGYDREKPFKITEHPTKFNYPSNMKRAKRIFVCSMGDLFHESVSFNKIASIMWHATREETKKHTFVLLTKRAERMREFFLEWYRLGFGGKAPLKNLWLGVTVENQRHDDRILALQQIPAAVRFVSFEPLLGPFDFLPPWLRFIDWVIVGGETGTGARPMEFEWARGLRDQCRAAGVPFFFKKVGGGHETPDDLNIREFPELLAREKGIV